MAFQLSASKFDIRYSALFCYSAQHSDYLLYGCVSFLLAPAGVKMTETSINPSLDSVMTDYFSRFLEHYLENQ